MMTQARDLDTGELVPEPAPAQLHTAPAAPLQASRTQQTAAPLQPAEDDWIDAQAAAKARLVSEAIDKVLAEAAQLQREIAASSVHGPTARSAHPARPTHPQTYEMSVSLRIKTGIVLFFALIGVLATIAFVTQQLAGL